MPGSGVPGCVAGHGARRRPPSQPIDRRSRSAGNADMIRYSLAALGAEPSPALSPQHYIVGLFDMYAETFDRDLVDKLNYHRRDCWRSSSHGACRRDVRLDILDIGCGTGLMGEGLRAAQANAYGRRSLTQHARTGARPRHLRPPHRKRHRGVPGDADRQFDVTVSTDVFIYIGDLAGIFAGVRRALRATAVLPFGGGCRRW